MRKKLTQSGVLHRHMRTHNAENHFSCPNVNCGKRFLRKDNLNRHIKVIHNGITPNQCLFCHCVFPDEKSKQSHENSCEPKTYACFECHKEFNRFDNLREHLKIHSSGKSFSCAVCRNRHEKCRHSSINDQSQKRKMTNFNAKVYNNIAEKKFSCDLCEYKTNKKFCYD